MGGKTRTFANLGAQAIYDPDDDMFVLDMLRTTALFGKFDSTLIMKTMINNVGKYLNTAKFDRLGIGGKMEINAASRDEETIQNYLSQKYNAEIFPFYDGYKDINGNTVDITAQRLHRFFEDNGYEIETSYTDTWHYSYTFRTVSGNVKLCNMSLNIREWHKWYYGTEESTASITIKTHLYKSPGGGGWYRIKSPIVITEDYDVEMEEMEQNQGGEWEPTGKTAWIRAASDFRILLLVKYAGWKHEDCPDPNMPIPTIEGMDLIYRENVVAKNYSFETLMFPIKHDFEFVENERYQKVVMSDWGFDQDDLREELDDEAIKDSFFTMSISSGSGQHLPLEVLQLMEEMYGNLNDTIGDGSPIFPEYYDPGSASPADVRIDSEYFKIEYLGELVLSDPMVPDNQGMIFRYKININGFQFSPYLPDEDGEAMPLFIIPLNPMLRTPMRKKYDVIKYGFSIWGYMEKTIKLKWYQTGFFRFISVIIGAIFAVLTFGALGLVFFAINQVFSIIGNLLGPLAGMILGLLMMGFNPLSMSWSFSTMIDNIMNSFFNIMLNFGKVMMQLQFQAKYDSLTEELDRTKDDTKELAEQLRDMINPSIYAPLDVLGNQYDLLYQMQFMPYDESSYDMMGQLDRDLMSPIQQSRIM